MLERLVAAIERIADMLEAFVTSQGTVVSTESEEPVKKKTTRKKKTTKKAATKKTSKAAKLAAKEDDDDDLDDMDDDFDDADDLDDLDDEEEAPPKPKRKTKKTGKKKVGRPRKKRSVKTEEEVRELLKELQLCTGDARQPKSILKKYGASNMNQLDEAKYDDICAELQDEIDQYE